MSSGIENSGANSRSFWRNSGFGLIAAQWIGVMMPEAPPYPYPLFE